MVAGCRVTEEILGKVADIYTWLDEQIRDNEKLSGRCNVCGKCCDFEGFDHRLFVTPPELMYLATNIGAENIKSMQGVCCPYQANGKCSIYKYRFAGCRIFCCNGDMDFQSRLSESVLKMFKSVCGEFQIPYRYSDLPAALNGLAGV
jgi:Fe-S-cluster containining protein